MAIRQNKSKKEDFFHSVVANAFDFMEKAIGEFESHPKHSVINFYTAVELIIKSRLMREHWSLVVSKDPDYQRFTSGDFVSVTFDVACERLTKIARSGLPDEAKKNFDSVRKHRNKMVHFFHETADDKNIIQSIAKEQLRAWYDLHKLMSTIWRDFYTDYYGKIQRIERLLGNHREFLKFKYLDIQDDIAKRKDNGVSFSICSSCSFPSAESEEPVEPVLTLRCLVCSYVDRSIKIECPECQKPGRLREGGSYTCDSPDCETALDAEGLADLLNSEMVDPSDAYNARTPAHCGECEGYHTVIEFNHRYLCLQCLQFSSDISACEFCGEFGTGTLEESYSSGCIACEGNVGWQSGKDD